jgi:hypothetical protein
VIGKATGYVRTGGQGARFVFRFCPVCGTTVSHTEEGEESSVGVAVGAFADPSFRAPRLSITDCRRPPWAQLPPGTTAFEQDPIGGGGAGALPRGPALRDNLQGTSRPRGRARPGVHSMYGGAS